MSTYNLYVLRAHLQARAKMEISGERYSVYRSKEHNLRDYRECPPPPSDEPIKNVEKYEIELNTSNPNLPDLYEKIREVCPEFEHKRSFHLYWKNSESTILPISNYIMYVSMVSVIANTNNNLYLVAREWEGAWLTDPRATYMAVPEDVVLVNLVAPRQRAYTVVQEKVIEVAQGAARVEATTTYSPPRVSGRKKSSRVKERKKSAESKERKKSPKRGKKK